MRRISSSSFSGSSGSMGPPIRFGSSNASVSVLCQPAARAALFEGIVPRDMPPAAGATLGPYAIVAQIGAGGMGEVYRARDTRLNRTVAVKVLPPHFSDDPEMKQRFEREAQTVAGLNHPH